MDPAHHRLHCHSIPHNTEPRTCFLEPDSMRPSVLTLVQTIARRVPPKPHNGPFIDLSLFKSAPYSIFSLSLFMGFLGIYTVRPLFEWRHRDHILTECLSAVLDLHISERHSGWRRQRPVFLPALHRKRVLAHRPSRRWPRRGSLR